MTYFCFKFLRSFLPELPAVFLDLHDDVFSLIFSNKPQSPGIILRLIWNLFKKINCIRLDLKAPELSGLNTNVRHIYIFVTTASLSHKIPNRKIFIPKNDTGHTDNWKAALLFGNRFVLKWRHSFTDFSLNCPMWCATYTLFLDCNSLKKWQSKVVLFFFVVKLFSKRRNSSQSCYKTMASYTDW